MNKLNPIKYIESMLSHHPKSFYLWITDGIVIDDKRYIIKEFRFRNGKLYAVIAENKYNPKYFEVQLCPDEETLKAIYKAIEDNKIAINKEIIDRTNEITRVDAAIKANTTKINQEITDRTNEINRVDTVVKENTAKINKEITDRTSEIARVDKAINANTTKINQEITDRTSEISRVDSAINKEITDRTGEISRVDSAIKANTTKIEQETTDRQNEITRVDAAIESNTAKITKETTDRTNEITRLDKALKDNKGSIDQDIARIDNAINENTTKINQEITNRQNEINRVDEAINSNTTKINQEITDRNSEITRVNSAIESNTTKINKEITDRTSEVARLDKTIKDNKAAADQTAEGLKTRIESLETYKDGEQTRANQYFESAKAETTHQLTAERTANANTYVTKETHTSDVNDIRNDLATTNATVETAISKADTAQSTANNNAQTINALNSSLAQKQDKLTAGKGIAIQDNVISATGDSAPQHDTQKEQVLESTRNTVTIEHGSNGTSETTKVDTNPAKVLEHSNLLTDYGISKNTTGNTTKLGLEYTRVNDGYDLNNLFNGRVRSGVFLNAPENGRWLFVSAYTENMYTIQEAVALVDPKNTTYRRTRQNGSWGPWREQAGDKSVIDAAISANTTKINQEITDRQNEITRVEGKIPTSLDSLNLMTGTRDWSTKANKWHMGEYWSTESEEYQGLKVHSTKNGYNGSHQNIFVKNGDVVTLSFYAKATNTLSKIKVSSRWNGSSVYQAPLAGVKESDEQITITREWKRYSKTVHITSDGSLQFRVEYDGVTIPDGNTFYVAGLKLAKTSQDTGYSENPTDTAGDINMLSSRVTTAENNITRVDNKVCKTVNIDTTNYSGHYSISNGVVTQYKVVAKDGKYIDLDNFTFSNGTDPLASARLDSRLLKVLFEYVDTQNKTLLTTSNALFTIDDQHKFVIHKTQVTSALCVKNLSTVKSISLL